MYFEKKNFFWKVFLIPKDNFISLLHFEITQFILMIQPITYGNAKSLFERETRIIILCVLTYIGLFDDNVLAKTLKN